MVIIGSAMPPRPDGRDAARRRNALPADAAAEPMRERHGMTGPNASGPGLAVWQVEGVWRSTVPAITAFSTNPSQTPLERSALGCVNDARTDVGRDAAKRR
jgi:hypothetical protein